jgi:glutathione S-transferase
MIGVPYEMNRYQREAKTRLAPPELTAVHPLGKSPVITDGDVRIAESGAIVDYIIRTYGKGAMMPAVGSADYEAYNEWLHYSEGSAMLPLMLNLYVSRLKEAGAPLHPRIDREMANHLGYVDGALQSKEFFVGKSLTGADIQMSFVGDMAKVFDKLGPRVAVAHARAPGVPAVDREGRGVPVREVAARRPATPFGSSCPGQSAKRIFALDDPGIQLFLAEPEDVDGREKPDKPGHDELATSVICPTGKSLIGLSSPDSKNILLPAYPKSNLYPSPSHPTEGRIAIVTDAGRDAVDAGSALDESC